MEKLGKTKLVVWWIDVTNKILYITVLLICNKNMFLSGNIPTQEVYDNSKAAMRASFGHMERPDNSEYRPTVETIHSMLRSI